MLLPLTALLLSTAALQQDLMFGADPDRTGLFQSAAMDRYRGLNWRFMTNGRIYSTPAVSGDLVFVGSGDGNLYAIDRNTGMERWAFSSGGAVHSAPAVVGEVVVAQNSTGKVFALDKASGRLIWSLLGGDPVPWPWGYESGDYYYSSGLAVDGDVVIGHHDGHVYRIDGPTGRVVWSAETGGRVRSSPSSDGSTIYVGSADGYVYAFDLSTGALRWRFETLGASLYSGDFGFDRSTVQSSPAVGDGRVFVGARDGLLYAIDAESGEEVWEFDHEVSWVNTSPAYVDGVVYAGSSDGRFVQAVDGATGTEIWRTDTRSGVWFSPVVVDSLVYFGDLGRNLTAYHRETGEVVWTEPIGGGLYGSMIFGGDAAFIAGADGAVYSLVLDGPPLERAVFWDSTYADSSFFRDGREIVTALGSGYRTVNAPELESLLAAAAPRSSPSVVVFAMDGLPVGSDSLLLRRYLDASGKVVWLGDPPYIWGKEETGEYSLPLIDRTRTTRVTGVDHDLGNFGPRGVLSTELGTRLGLPERWAAPWAVDPGAVTHVLATNELGQAVAYVKEFGIPGNGFWRVWGARISPPDPSVVKYLAELRGPLAD